MASRSAVALVADETQTSPSRISAHIWECAWERGWECVSRHVEQEPRDSVAGHALLQITDVANMHGKKRKTGAGSQRARITHAT
jgi:hypothetical protein